MAQPLIERPNSNSLNFGSFQQKMLLLKKKLYLETRETNLLDLGMFYHSH
jgi:hypothetical protein